MKAKAPQKPEGTLTLDQIARFAGTSKSTVSRVISNDPRISEKTRLKVAAIIEKQHYRPNLFARALAGGKTGLIGVISSNIGSGFYAEVIRGIDLVFNQSGKRLLVSFAHFAGDYRALWEDFVHGGQVEGIIMLAPTSDFFNLALELTKIPVVLCVGKPPRDPGGWNTLDRVDMNNTQAMEGIVADLASRGCRTLLHAAGWDNNTDAVDRRQAFLRSCRRHGLRAETAPFGIIQSDGRDAMRERMRNTRTLPDAIVAFNDSVALGILEAWHERAGNASSPPFALTGWDDSPAAAAIGLSSVAIPFTALGERAAELLRDRLQPESAARAARHERIDLTVRTRSSSSPS